MIKLNLTLKINFQKYHVGDLLLFMIKSPQVI